MVQESSQLASAGSASAGGNLELGELGQLTITNDNESAYDVSLTERIARSRMITQKCNYQNLCLHTDNDALTDSQNLECQVHPAEPL